MKTLRVLRPSARTQAVLLLALVGSLGLLAGMVLERTLLTPDPAPRSPVATAGEAGEGESGNRTGPGAAGETARPPGRAPGLRERLSRPAGEEEIARLVERIAPALALDSVQSAALDSLLRAQSRELREITREARGRYREVVVETRRRIGELLTPEQRTRLRRLLRDGAPGAPRP